MNNHHTPLPNPTARCKTYAALLPILDEPGIDPDAAAEARAHLATCAYCQQQRAAYRQLELAASRYLAPPASPSYRTEAIMLDLLGEPVDGAGEGEPATATETYISPRKPRSARRFITSLAPLAAVLVIVLITVTLFANHGRFMGNSTSNPPTPAVGSDTELSDVDMISPTEGWAVGFTFPILQVETVDDMGPGVSWGGQVDLAHETVVLLHYFQGRWTPIHLSIYGQLTSIVMLSATDGWAVGYTPRGLFPPNGHFNGLFLHYDGHSWKQVAAGPMNGFNFGRLQMLSDTDGWATANSSIVHYDGHSWTTQPIPASLEPDTHYVALNSVFMTSPSAGWATGYTQPATNNVPTGSPSGIILRYLNGQWSLYQTIPNALMGTISMTSADDGWLSGSSLAGANPPPILLHYTHNTWTQVPDPLDAAESPDASFDDISMRSPTDGWMLVTMGISSLQLGILRYDGSQWRLERLPIDWKNMVPQVFSISMASANDGWIAGSLVPKSIDRATKPPSFNITPLLLHLYNGTWSITSPS